MTSTHWKDNPPSFSFTHHPSLEPFNATYTAFCASAAEEYDGLVVGALVFRRQKPFPRTPPPPSPSSSRQQDGKGEATRPAKVEIQEEEEEDHILLVKRSRTDSMPLLWEIPGGSVDLEDPSILHATARELWEESGLIPHHIRRVVVDTITSSTSSTSYSKDGLGNTFLTRRGLTVAKYSFETEVLNLGNGEKDDGDDGDEDHVMVKLDPEEHERYLWVSKREVEASECVRGRGRDDATITTTTTTTTNGDGDGDDDDDGRELVRLNMTTNDQRLVVLEGFRLREEDRKGGK